MTSTIIRPHRTLVFDDIINQVSEKGFAVQNDFISTLYANQLRLDILRKYYSGRFRKSKIGHHNNVSEQQEIRSDYIQWIDTNNPEDLYRPFIDHIIEFGKWLNKFCYTGLNDLEMHSAVYPRGSFYKRHIDTSLLNKKRVYTFILYLNNSWKYDDGGQLRLYINDHYRDIDPYQCRLVFFESDKLPHEVLTSNFERISISGWLKIDELKGEDHVFSTFK